MRAIAYLASYPRSGNTFLRALLANYLDGRDRPLSTQEIAHFGFGEHDEALLARCTGLRGAERTVRDQWVGRSEYFKLLRQAGGSGPAFVKTHTINGEVFGRSAFDFQPDDKAVYVLRHPFDVAVSGSLFFGVSQEQMAARMVLSGATNHSGDAFFEVTGSWGEHVGGWLNEPNAPVLVIRFEELRAKPAVQLRKVLRFLGQPIVHERVHFAVRNASFALLKTSQQSEGFYQGPDRDPRATFFREGKAGGWRKTLDPAVASYLTEALQEPMRSLKYSGLNRR